MDDKLKCKIVEDLLPNYIDNLNSEETNEFIKNHLNECTNCKNIYERMKNEVSINENRNDKKQVNFIKKYNSKMKIFKSIFVIVVLIILVLFIHTLRNFIIIKNMINKADYYKNESNYYIGTTSTGGDKTDYYVKDNKYLMKMTHKANEGLHTLINYYDGEKTNSYFEVEKEEGIDKVAILDSNGFPIGSGFNGIFENMSIKELLIMSFLAKVRNTDLNGKDCYKFENFYSPNILYKEGHMEFYVEKETGFTIKQQTDYILDENGNRIPVIIDYVYKFNIVTDQDVKEPDISEYKVQ